jgi:hypothetical protein
MKRSYLKLIIGVVIFVAGAAVLVYGYVTYNDVHASLGSALSRAFTGSSKDEQTAVIEMIVGGAVAVIGLAVMLIPAGRRRRR